MAIQAQVLSDTSISPTPTSHPITLSPYHLTDIGIDTDIDIDIDVAVVLELLAHRKTFMRFRPPGRPPYCARSSTCDSRGCVGCGTTTTHLASLLFCVDRPIDTLVFICCAIYSPISILEHIFQKISTQKKMSVVLGILSNFFPFLPLHPC